LTRFPASLIYYVYYRRKDKIHHIKEQGVWSKLTSKQLEREIKKHTLNDEKYFVIYEHIVLNKKDYWEAHPEKINKNELEFWYFYGLLTEEEYLCFINIS
jgi:hypothetical protein